MPEQISRLKIKIFENIFCGVMNGFAFLMFCIQFASFTYINFTPNLQQMKIEIGQQAPDFLMYNTEKEAVRLSEQQGKNIVLLFFPFAFTSTCTAELCATRDDIHFYQNVNADVYGISVDAPYSLKVFKAEQQLNFDLLSDFNKIVSETYGCIYDRWGMELKGVSKRSAFVIDTKGIIQYIEILDNAGEVPDFDAIKKVLETLQ